MSVPFAAKITVLSVQHKQVINLRGISYLTHTQHMNLLITFSPKYKGRPGEAYFHPVLLEACRFYVWCSHYIRIYKGNSANLYLWASPLWIPCDSLLSSWPLRWTGEFLVPRFWTVFFLPLWSTLLFSVSVLLLDILTFSFLGFPHFSSFTCMWVWLS